MPTNKKTTTKTAKAANRPPKGGRAPRSAPTAMNGASTSSGRGRNRHDLVIVESPAKARTIAGILGPGFEITASVGHVRDLPKSKLGVDIEHEFAPQYLVPKEKREIVNRIKEAAMRANTVYLATDPDREGEAISWHLVEAADLENKPLQRVVFHELTPEAVRAAFDHPRQIDSSLVDAQQARRILDRLVGYKISPLLWKKVRRGTSAGRVQSAALRMVVEREREILGFTAKEYWTIDALLNKAAAPRDTAPFAARLRGVAGTRLFEIPDAATSEKISGALRSAAYAVKAVRRRDQHRRPAPPFTTSTLQQEASRRFGFTARRTMALAQQLYEGVELRGAGRVGLITYMRTDSTNLAETAVAEIRGFIMRRFGGDFVPAAPRVYKSRKGAQEAHEAIRPTSASRAPESPELRTLTVDQRRLYTLIWQRTVACQMADAVLDSVSVDIDAVSGPETYLFRVTASVLRFPGFRQVYDEARDDVDTQAPPEIQLPDLATGDPLRLEDLKPEQHFTEPPPRYTEATLVKALEENGIGRPSTYAPIMSTIQERGYVERLDNRQLRPTELGFVVNDFLIEQFPDFVDLKFTAQLEEDLDEIASGARLWQPLVREFYNPLSDALAAAADAPVVTQETGELCPESGHPLIRRFGRFGPFLACSGFPECKYTRPDGDASEAQKTDEKCDVCGSEMVVKRGRFGAFLACSRYPECKGTKPLLQKTGILCPKDGGEIVERATRKGRHFYGCANYPKCDFTSWQRPLAEVCPECGGLIVAERGRRAKCTACGWSGPASQAKPAGTRAVVASV